MTQSGYSSFHIFPHPSHKVRSSVRDDPLVPDQTHSVPIKPTRSRSNTGHHVSSSSQCFPFQVISLTLITNHSHRRSHYLSRPTLLIVHIIHPSHTTSFLIVFPLIFLISPSLVCQHCRAIQGLCAVPALNSSLYIVVANCLYSLRLC